MAVTEIVQVYGAEGAGDELAKTFESIVDLLTQDPECHGVRVFHGIEDPDRFVLAVDWTSVDAHEAWRASEAREQWRAALSPFVTKPNEMAHYTLVVAT
jgi:quinol monooxygenase YgiN